MSTDPTETPSFEKQLEVVYQQYRHRQLESKLADIAEKMEETILQRILAERFLDTEMELDEEAKEAVATAREHLHTGDYEALGNEMDELRRLIEDQQRRVSNGIQESRVTMRKRVNGMRRLNDRVERVSDVKIQAVHELLRDWDWKGQVYREEDYAFETLEERAAEYGEDMRRYFEECREEIFGPYRGTALESIVDGLSSEERLSLDELSDEQVDQLRDSELEGHVELSLS